MTRSPCHSPSHGLDLATPHAHLNSPLHRWDPSHKILGILALIFAFALVQDLRLVPPMMAISATYYGLSQLPLSLWWQRLRYPGLFMGGVVFLLPWVSGSTVVAQWGSLTLYQEGLTLALVIVGRFISILTLGLVLLGTSPFLTTVKALRSLGLPSILADMILLTYRYLYDLDAMFHTMQQAMGLRGYGWRSSHLPQESPIQPWGQRLQQLANLAGTLLIRSYEQSDRVYQAMGLRGYSLPQAPRPFPIPPTPSHSLGLILTLAIVLIFVITDWILVQ